MTQPGSEQPFRSPGEDLPPEISAPPAVEPDTSSPPARRERPVRTFTRISAAWTGVWAGVVVVILLIVFIAQNTGDVRIRFFWMSGVMPTAVALLIAGVAGAIIAMAVAAARIVQLRRQMRRR